MQIAAENITTLEAPVINMLSAQEEKLVHFLSEIIVNTTINSNEESN